MRDLDETDLEILQLLLADGRRPYSEIGERVDLSGPAVSDRVERLRELGVVEGFTVEIDRSTLSAGTEFVLELDAEPGTATAHYDALREDAGVQHVYRTAGGRVVAHVALADDDVEAWVDDTLEPDAVRSYEVRLLAESARTSDVRGADFAFACAECGNRVTSEGTAERIGGDLYQFCCPNCLARFEERYAELEEGA